jgi:hypothetical protein
LELPISFTMDAAHDGPPPVLMLGWSEFWPVGVTHVTLARLQVEMSDNTVAGFSTTFAHSLPVQLTLPLTFCALQSALMEFGAIQIASGLAP